MLRNHAIRLDRCSTTSEETALTTSWQRNWLLTLAGRNLTDERAGIQGFDLATLCGCNEVSYRAPRFYSVGVRYSF